MPSFRKKLGQLITKREHGIKLSAYATCLPFAFSAARSAHSPVGLISVKRYNPTVLLRKALFRGRLCAGLNLTKALDNVLNTSILDTLASLNVGACTYSYIRNFLTNIVALLSVNNLPAPSITLGEKGTPQESVFSPFLISLAMFHFLPLLEDIPNLHHSTYIDDIPL
ncbi:hypothetical protein HPB50_012521 [Hyalomma asiaticum]|uniref:Uncharacterized protein n=1 Tax=Hyalomma asiaticum TaxID=266040 RepID=A0ACB7SN47_HYAAI|nr:hypothetical protein HPB50_012521 [Hyalomma asiaticum]